MSKRAARLSHNAQTEAMPAEGRRPRAHAIAALAPTNKFLAETIKTRTGGAATKKRKGLSWCIARTTDLQLGLASGLAR
jgi:hypothetical protein